jgi:hypothetical protein
MADKLAALELDQWFRSVTDLAQRGLATSVPYATSMAQLGLAISVRCAGGIAEWGSNFGVIDWLLLLLCTISGSLLVNVLWFFVKALIPLWR